MGRGLEFSELQRLLAVRTGLRHGLEASAACRAKVNQRRGQFGQRRLCLPSGPLRRTSHRPQPAANALDQTVWHLGFVAHTLALAPRASCAMASPRSGTCQDPCTLIDPRLRIWVKVVESGARTGTPAGMKINLGGGPFDGPFRPPDIGSPARRGIACPLPSFFNWTLFRMAPRHPRWNPSGAQIGSPLTPAGGAALPPKPICPVAWRRSASGLGPSEFVAE